MRVYLDNAATTPLHPEVLQAMIPYLEKYYGNPSAQYEEGRAVKSAIEAGRKQIAQLINATPGEIIFTSGGTESNNMALRSAVADHQVTTIITSAIEHHCVSHTLEYLHTSRGINCIILPVDNRGYIDMLSLENHLATAEGKILVSIMHGNNEIGTIQDITTISKLCKAYNALFHSDTVQTVGHYTFDVQALGIDYLSASAHKFHGPKGVGFLYIRKPLKGKPLLYGGGQERNMRAGTENVSGIVGICKAITIAYAHLDADAEYIRSLKTYCINQLTTTLPNIAFNGDVNGLYTVLNISLPPHELGSLLLFKLDMEGISASSGSACNSGASTVSHVIEAIQMPSNCHALRISFSKFNTKEDIDKLVSVLSSLYDNNI
jgi:cysteine desulfurase